MPNINQGDFVEPTTINEKWWFSKIREMINDAKYGGIEIEITLQNKTVATIKEHTRRSHSFYNDK